MDETQIRAIVREELLALLADGEVIDRIEKALAARIPSLRDAPQEEHDRVRVLMGLPPESESH